MLVLHCSLSRRYLCGIVVHKTRRISLCWSGNCPHNQSRHNVLFLYNTGHCSQGAFSWEPCLIKIEMFKVRLMTKSNKSVIRLTVIHSNTWCDNWLIYLSAQACNSVVKSNGLALYFKYCQVKPSIWSSSSFKSATLCSSSLIYSPYSSPPTSPPLCQHLANSSPFTRIFSIEKTFSLLLETSLHWPSRKLLDHFSR